MKFNCKGTKNCASRKHRAQYILKHGISSHFPFHNPAFEAPINVLEEFAIDCAGAKYCAPTTGTLSLFD